MVGFTRSIYPVPFAVLGRRGHCFGWQFRSRFFFQFSSGSVSAYSCDTPSVLVLQLLIEFTPTFCRVHGRSMTVRDPSGHFNFQFSFFIFYFLIFCQSFLIILLKKLIRQAKFYFLFLIFIFLFSFSLFYF